MSKFAVWLSASLLALSSASVMGGQDSFATSKNTWRGHWGVVSASFITPQEAIKKAKRRYQGKVLSAKMADLKGRQVYKIKIIMPDSRVKVVLMDAKTGAFIGKSH